MAILMIKAETNDKKNYLVCGRFGNKFVVEFLKENFYLSYIFFKFWFSEYVELHLVFQLPKNFILNNMCSRET